MIFSQYYQIFLFPLQPKFIILNKINGCGQHSAICIVIHQLRSIQLNLLMKKNFSQRMIKHWFHLQTAFLLIKLLITIRGRYAAIYFCSICPSTFCLIFIKRQFLERIMSFSLLYNFSWYKSCGHCSCMCVLETKVNYLFNISALIFFPVILVQQEVENSLYSVHIPDQILTQSSELNSSKSGGSPTMNISNQFPVNNVVGPTYLGKMTSNYLSTSCSYADSSCN